MATQVAIAPLRRVPVQVRSVARVQRMLDACAEIVDEVGYEGLSTTLLAERAGVAIGSVYQFFGDKRQVVQALTQRNVQAYKDRLSARFMIGGFTHWWEAVDTAIDEYIDMHRTVPGFRTLHFGDVVDAHLLDDEQDNNAVIAGKLGDLLAEHFQTPRAAQVEQALRVAVVAADALINEAFRRDAKGDQDVIAEAKEMIRPYLYRRVSPTASDGAQAASVFGGVERAQALPV